MRALRAAGRAARWSGCYVPSEAPGVGSRGRGFAAVIRREEQQEVFALLDPKGCGAIAGDDLEVALRSLGWDASRSEALRLLRGARVSAKGFASIIASEFEPSESADENAVFGVFDAAASGFIAAPNLRAVINHLGDSLSEQDVEEIMAWARRDVDRLGLEASAWPPSEQRAGEGGGSAALEQVDIPADLLQSAIAAQATTYDERYRKGRENPSESTNPAAQAQAFGRRDATGVEAVHDAMPMEVEVFNSLATKEAQRLCQTGSSSSTIRVLDFGCGDGRYLQLYTRTSRALRERQGCSLRVVAYDISSEALHTFRRRAKEAGMRDSGESPGVGGDVLSTGELSVHFVLGDSAASVDDVRELLRSTEPEFDLVVVGWGTLSSIPRLPGLDPEKLLELFANIGRSIMNVASSTNNHVTFQQEFDERRKAYRATSSEKLRAWLQPKIGLATFAGSYYYPLDTGGRQFYAAVTAEQEASRLEAAGYVDVSIRICNIINFFDISTKPKAARINAHIIRLLEDGEVWRAQLALCHGVARASGRPFEAVWSGSCMFDTSSKLACFGQVARYFISTGTSRASRTLDAG